MMCTFTPGKTENIPQASFIHPSLFIFYPAWWLKQSSLLGFFHRDPNASRRTSELNVNITQSQRMYRPQGYYKKNKFWKLRLPLGLSQVKFAKIVALFSTISTCRISQNPDIGKMPKCFSVMCILNNLGGKAKFLLSTPGSHSRACLPYEKCIHLPTHWERENIVLLYCMGKHFKNTWQLSVVSKLFLG